MHGADAAIASLISCMLLCSGLFTRNTRERACQLKPKIQNKFYMEHIPLRVCQNNLPLDWFLKIKMIMLRRKNITITKKINTMFDQAKKK